MLFRYLSRVVLTFIAISITVMDLMEKKERVVDSMHLLAAACMQSFMEFVKIDLHAE